MIPIFVYGTLQPGEINDWVWADAVVKAQPAIAIGQLYHLPFGYPALSEGTQTVHGFLLCFADPSILQRLDEFERHDPIALHPFIGTDSPQDYNYDRQWIEVFALDFEVFDLDRRSLGQAWVYRMTIAQINKIGGIPLSTEQWNSRQVD